MHRTADVVGEQGAVVGAGGQFVYEALMDGAPVADDQRRAGDNGLRMHDEDAGLRCRLCCSVRGDGVGQAGLVVVDSGTGEHCVAGHLDQAAAALRRGHRDPDRALGRSRPVGLAARCVDDEMRAHLGHDGVQTSRIPQIKGVPLGLGSVAGPGRVGRGCCVPGRSRLPDQFVPQEAAAADDQSCHVRHGRGPGGYLRWRCPASLRGRACRRSLWDLCLGSLHGIREP